MQKQSGACAFSNACNIPGPRERVAGTNREFCHVHYLAMALPSGTSTAMDFSHAQFHVPPRRRRSRWLSGVGM